MLNDKGENPDFRICHLTCEPRSQKLVRITGRAIPWESEPGRRALEQHYSWLRGIRGYQQMFDWRDEGGEGEHPGFPKEESLREGGLSLRAAWRRSGTKRLSIKRHQDARSFPVQTQPLRKNIPPVQEVSG